MTATNGGPGPAADETRPRPGPPGASDRLWPRLVLSLVTVALMLPVMEVAVCRVAPQPVSWLAVYRRHPTLPLYSLQPNADTTVDTGEARWKIRTDDHGFRIGRQMPPDDGRPVVLWLGDSFTFGFGVDYEDTFVGRLALDPGRRVRHVNTSVAGYGPLQYADTLEYVLGTGLKPRTVVVAIFLGNDFVDCVESRDLPVRDGILGNRGGPRIYLKRRFHLYRLVSKAVHRFELPDFIRDLRANPAREDEASAFPLDEADRKFRQALERIAARCSENGMNLAVLVLPDPRTLEHTEVPSGLPAPSVLAARAASIFRDLGLRTLDVTPVLALYPPKELFFLWDSHFTPRGHELVADAVRREWSDLL